MFWDKINILPDRESRKKSGKRVHMSVLNTKRERHYPTYSKLNRQLACQLI
jgi:hypothetical protein